MGEKRVEHAARNQCATTGAVQIGTRLQRKKLDPIRINGLARDDIPWHDRYRIQIPAARPIVYLHLADPPGTESVRTERWSQLLWWMSPMNCPHCQASQPRKLDKTTDLGYALFHCRRCKRKFNERTGSPFNYLEFPTDIVFQVVLCRLRYKLSLHDLAERSLLRGFEFTHETVREWEERFAPLLAEYVRGKRQGKCGRRWYVDETYLRIKGKWCYFYRAIDRAGNLVDSRLS